MLENSCLQVEKQRLNFEQNIYSPIVLKNNLSLMAKTKLAKMIKGTIKNIFGNICSVFNCPVLVNSYGRSGSTVLTKSIVNSANNSKNKIIKNFAIRCISQTAWDLENTNLKNGIVYKTHDYPPAKKINSKVRILYTFSDPIDVVLSLIRLYNERGEKWMKQHYSHLRATYSNFQNIIYEDQLQLKKHLKSWLRETRFPIAFIKYETMWDHQKEISDFLECKINLPPFRKRRAKQNPNQEIIKKIGNTYKDLQNQIDILDNFFVKNL